MVVKKSPFETIYETAQEGTLSFQRQEALDPEILAVLSLVEQLKEDLSADPVVAEGLAQLEVKLQALRTAGGPVEEVRKKLNELMEVRAGQGKTFRLEAFRKTSASGKLATAEDYTARVHKLIDNTLANLAHLLAAWPNDTILQHLVRNLRGYRQIREFQPLKQNMDELGKSPGLWYYNDKKRQFLLDWLKPFQEYLDQPVEKLNADGLAQAMKKVDALRERRLKELTHLMVIEDTAPYRAHNHASHPVMNGQKADFWGSNLARRDFVDLINQVIHQFRFDLDNRFLMFASKDGEFAYLVGFADDAILESQALKDGTLAIFPHLKVFVKDSGGAYKELEPQGFEKDPAQYFKTLKTAVVPFLAAVAKMTGKDVSPSLREAFDMWI
ncbi:MAG: hypothetical protein OEV94_00595 [Deltaproteobacteria bacterium]|nr:hypothetical protein [Deltaproteobacteria bacterium]